MGNHLYATPEKLKEAIKERSAQLINPYRSRDLTSIPIVIFIGKHIKNKQILADYTKIVDEMRPSLNYFDDIATKVKMLVSNLDDKSEEELRILNDKLVDFGMSVEMAMHRNRLKDLLYDMHDIIKPIQPEVFEIATNATFGFMPQANADGCLVASDVTKIYNKLDMLAPGVNDSSDRDALILNRVQELTITRDAAIARRTELRQILSRLVGDKAALESQSREGMEWLEQDGGCIRSQSLTGPMMAMSPIIDINAEIAAINAEIAALTAQQVELNTQISALQSAIKNKSDRSAKVSALKAAADKDMCCMQSGTLLSYADHNGSVFSKPITPAEYCGEFWGRGAACDTRYSEMCTATAAGVANPKCACYAKPADASDNKLQAAVKANPRCYSVACDSKNYLPSSQKYDDACDTLTSCDASLSADIKNVVSGDCASPYSGSMFYILLLIIAVLCGAGYFGWKKYTAAADTSQPEPAAPTPA